MTTAVVVFPGTNCEHDVRYALDVVGLDAELVWHRDTDLLGADSVVLPGGFAHGDYLRTGAIARFSPVMAEVQRLADAGTPVLGICNGFQILCEAGILAGALVANQGLKFVCEPITVRVESTDSILTATATVGQVLHIPLNSYEGNYVAHNAGALVDDGTVVLRYCNENGDVSAVSNPNGSMSAIAGITNDRRNVAGLMPHPERAIEEILGSSDGRILLESFASSIPATRA